MLVFADLDGAESAGVISAQEAFALGVLAENEDNTVPDELLDAVERLWLWMCDTPEKKH